MAPCEKKRLKRIEKYLGIGKGGKLPTFSVRDTLNALNGQIQEMNKMIQRIVDKQSEETSPNGSFSGKEQEVDAELEYLREEVVVLRKAMNGDNSSSHGVERVRLPEPKGFDGARESKTLENFIWDMEHYFKVSKRKDAQKVDIAALYLKDDAKLWWRSREEADRASGKDPINTWEEMKAALRKQFLPKNTSWVACDGLRELRRTGTVREYVKEFMPLLLDIDGMSEEDKLFAFVSGLKPWAQTELRRQRIEDLSTAIAAAEALVDLTYVSENRGKANQGKNAKKRKFEEDDDSDTTPSKKSKYNSKVGSGCFICKGPHLIRDCPKRTDGCFICKGPHLARDCPQREKLSALLADDKGDKAVMDDDIQPKM